MSQLELFGDADDLDGYVRATYRYDPDTGVVTYRRRTRKHAPGEVAGCVDSHGYVVVAVHWTSGRLRMVRLSRLAWFFMTGAWPVHEVDHRNRRRDDNRWSNLREATHAQNAANRTVRRDSSSGVNGVSRTRSGKWLVTVAGERKGIFARKSEAKQARKVFARARWGPFSSDG